MRHLAARCLVLGSVVFAPSAAAQSTTPNRVSGFVSDFLGVPVAFAELMSVGDIGAMEVYTSRAGVPPQYTDRLNPCGAILFWTRRK